MSLLNIKFENESFNQSYKKYLEKVQLYDSKELHNQFKAECVTFSELAKKYLEKYQDSYLHLSKDIVRKEYAIGGELLARGYYCPSPIYDIVTGNCKRGTLLKRITSKSKPTYEYCYDQNNRLILINYLHSNLSEILEYNDNIVTGITFSNTLNCEVSSIIECIYDNKNRIISFVKADCDYNNCHIYHLEKEIYIYNQQGLHISEVFDFNNSKPSQINYTKYTFEHDSAGYLSKYLAEPSMFEDNTFNVRVKRKI